MKRTALEAETLGAMAESVPLQEAGKELHEHHSATADTGLRREVVSVVEAVLLSVVTITAAWSGYAAAKWRRTRG